MAKAEHQIYLGLNARQFRKGIENVQNDMSKLNRAMTAFTAIWAGSQAIEMVLGFEKLGAEVINVEAAFNRLGNSDLLGNLRESTQNVVTDLELMKQAVKFKNFGLPVEQLGSLLQFASKQAAETGQSIDYLTDSLVTGLGRNSLKIIDNLSIDMNKFMRYTKEGLGYTEALVATIDDMGAGGQFATTVSEAQKLETSFKNLKNELSKEINPLLSHTLEGILREIKLYVAIIKEARDFFPGGEDPVEATGSWEPSPLTAELTDAQKKAEALRLELEAITQSLALLQANSSIRQESAGIFGIDVGEIDWDPITYGLDEIIAKEDEATAAANRFAAAIDAIMNAADDEEGNWEGLEENLSLMKMQADEAAASMEYLAQVGQDVFSAIASSLSGALTKGEDFVQGLVDSLIQLAFQFLATAAAAAILNAMTGGAASAVGGIVQAGIGSLSGVLRGDHIRVSNQRSGQTQSRTGGK